MKIYDIEIPGKLNHRVTIDESGKADAGTRALMAKQFLDWDEFEHKPFENFLTFLKHEYRHRGISVKEVAPENAGSSIESSEAVNKNGLMVAFYLPEEVAEELSIPGGEAPEELHLTLSFCGLTADLPADALEKAKTVVCEFAKTHSPQHVQITGIGRFSGTAGSPSSGKDIVYASVSSPDLNAFREALVARLTEAGVAPKSQFGFNPHVTLKYLNAHEDTPVNNIPKITVPLNTLCVASGDTHAEYSLLS
jgi:2'-5' RNA ligase